MTITTLDQINHLQAWVADLRADKYAQIQGALRRTSTTQEGATGYCCLGVACNTYARIEGKGEWMMHDLMHDHFFVGEIGVDTDLSELPVRKWLGIKEAEEVELMQMNDDGGLSFKKIADYVEEEILPRLERKLFRQQAAERKERELCVA